MTRPILIIGASARAASVSALRAGFNPRCLDLFGDTDLVSICPTQQVVEGYPESLERLCQQQPPSPWIYTGGLENRPSLIGKIASARPLLGNNRDVLVRARNPFLVFQHLFRAGLPVPRVAGRLPFPSSQRWLRKAFHHVGGSGIQFAEDPASEDLHQGNVYFQEWIEGLSASALFVAGKKSTRLAGLSWQLVGESWLGARPFRYCGSIGPIAVSKQVEDQLNQLGNLLREEFQLRGIFGVDGILNNHGFWPVEINPRYTASVEVIERATGWLSLEEHVRAFDSPPESSAEAPEGQLPIYPGGFHSPIKTLPGHGLVGKGILFAGRTVRADRFDHSMLSRPTGNGWPMLADIPQPGSRIEEGWPIVSVFAHAETETECLQQLRDRVKIIRQIVDSWE